MREILFRGKAINRDRYESFRTDYKNGDWVYGLLTRKFDERFENLPAEMTNEDGISGIDVDYKTIGEYTGLNDRNGTRIFEGDIVKAPYIDPIFHSTWDIDKQPTEVALVKFDMGQYYIDYIEGQYRFTVYVCQEYIEVIGNIYDNPELVTTVRSEV